jgi:hypothetical protein
MVMKQFGAALGAVVTGAVTILATVARAVGRRGDRS